MQQQSFNLSYLIFLDYLPPASESFIFSLIVYCSQAQASQASSIYQLPLLLDIILSHENKSLFPLLLLALLIAPIIGISAQSLILMIPNSFRSNSRYTTALNLLCCPNATEKIAKFGQKIAVDPT